MPDPSYHHSQRTRFSLEDAAKMVGKRASLTLEGTIIGARDMAAGAAVVFEVDERFGFDNLRLGGDLELLDIEDVDLPKEV